MPAGGGAAMTCCPSCKRSRNPGMYLCLDCWLTLPGGTRRALKRKDDRALVRLRELYRSVETGVPLAEIRVTP